MARRSSITKNIKLRKKYFPSLLSIERLQMKNHQEYVLTYIKKPSANEKFQPLPTPTGQSLYHFSLDIMSEDRNLEY